MEAKGPAPSDTLEEAMVSTVVASLAKAPTEGHVQGMAAPPRFPYLRSSLASFGTTVQGTGRSAIVMFKHS